MRRLQRQQIGLPGNFLHDDDFFCNCLHRLHGTPDRLPLTVTDISRDHPGTRSLSVKPALDAEGTHKIDWFFRDWVYGTDLPRYRLEDSVKPSEDGKVVLEAIFAAYASAGLGQKVHFPFKPTAERPVDEWLNRRNA